LKPRQVNAQNNQMSDSDESYSIESPPPKEVQTNQFEAKPERPIVVE